MKAISSAPLRGVLSILLGLALIIWPETAITYLVITLGVLFILPGIFSLISYFTRPKELVGSHFPIEGAGSILLGIWLVAMPAFFVNIVMYVLGACLLIAGIQQFFTLLRARKYYWVPWGLYVIPSLLLITGIIVLLNPFDTASAVFIVFGIAIVAYGVSELVNWYRFRPQTAKVIDNY